jgi:SOS-response transcriptional repressor LexA
MPEQSHNTPLGERIKAARKSAGLTLVRLSEQIGISNQALSAIERGQKNPSKQTLMNLAKTLRNGFGIDWLEGLIEEIEETRQGVKFFLEENKRRNDKEELREVFSEFLDFKFGTGSIAIMDLAKSVRLISLSARITAEHTIEELSNKEEIVIPARMMRLGQHTYGVLVMGDSLRDALVHPGDIIIANTDNAIADGKLALIELKGKISIKRISLKGRSVTLFPANSDYAPIKVSINKLNCVGEVTGLLRFPE